jgi:hypothetical protein
MEYSTTQSHCPSSTEIAAAPRTSTSEEVDFVVERGSDLLGIEVKATTRPRSAHPLSALVASHLSTGIPAYLRGVARGGG